MTERGPLTSLPVEAFDLRGRRIEVVIELISTDPGGLQITLRIDDETTVILPNRSAAQMIVNLREVLERKLLSE
jgi:hypothetical protein